MTSRSGTPILVVSRDAIVYALNECLFKRLKRRKEKRPRPEGSRPQLEENQPELEEDQPELEESRPPLEETQPQLEESQTRPRKNRPLLGKSVIGKENAVIR